jgi:hypothetical protein
MPLLIGARRRRQTRLIFEFRPEGAVSLMIGTLRDWQRTVGVLLLVDHRKVSGIHTLAKMCENQRQPPAKTRKIQETFFSVTFIVYGSRSLACS